MYHYFIRDNIYVVYFSLTSNHWKSHDYLHFVCCECDTTKQHWV